jgi:ribosomal protein S18 acetylase RimI-like enzyme
VTPPEDRIRPARPDDLDRCYEICLRTADAGADATALHGDPCLPGHVWAAPYLLFEPEHAFVVTGPDDRAGGYVVAALDSAAFEARLEAAWWPALRDRYPLDAAASRTPADQAAVRLVHHPPRADPALLAAHPSHLHVDLLPDHQGRGNGRRLLDTLLAALDDAGSAGVHLTVSTRNERAIGFYRAVGWRELGRTRHGVAFGRRLGPAAA